MLKSVTRENDLWNNGFSLRKSASLPRRAVFYNMLKAEMVIFIEESFTFGDHGEPYHMMKN
jgi:hypothetical protein